MKIAVIADIHGNIQALDAVLLDIKKRQVDQIICLGDLVGYGPNPNEVITCMRNHGIPSIMGNHDEAIGFYLPTCGCHIASPEQLKQSKNTMAWTAKETSEPNKAWLRDMPEYLETVWDGYDVYATHASVFSIHEYIYESDTERLQELVQEVGCDLLLFGHTHRPFIRVLDGCMVMNPGSVGKPKDGDWRASYGVIETKMSLKAKIIRVDYEVNQVIESICCTELMDVFGTMLSLGKSLP